MNIRNIMSFVVLSGLLATAQSQCMMSMVNKTIQKVGTIMGFGLATGPFIVAGTKAIYDTYTDPVAITPNIKPMAPEQEEFYREIVGDDVKLRSTEQMGNAFNLGNLIVMPETLCTKDGIISLDKALKENNVKDRSTFEGICEHENRHHLNKDSYKTASEIILIPTITTAVTAIALKKTLPASTTFAQHGARCVGKITAGYAGFHVNAELVQRVTSHSGRQQELAADQGISHKNRDAVLDFLDTMDSTHFMGLAKKYYPKATEQEQLNIAKDLKKKQYDSPYATHPSPERRRTALTPKKFKKPTKS